MRAIANYASKLTAIILKYYKLTHGGPLIADSTIVAAKRSY